MIGAMVAARYNPHLKSFRDKLVAAEKYDRRAFVRLAMIRLMLKRLTKPSPCS